MAKKSKYTKELLTPIIKDSHSWAQVLQKLTLRPTGGNYRNIQMRVKYLQISTTHFTGMLWSKGLTKDNNTSLKNISAKFKIPNDEVFKLNGHPLTTSKLHKRLLQDFKWEYKCSKCGLTTWQNEPISLDLDHINGNNRDNRLENLRFLCPNCHRQTKTWGNKPRN